MTLTLPRLLADMVAAHNAHDVDAFVACFSADAVLRDEGRTHVGQPAIRSWFDDACRKYRPIFEPTELAYTAGEPVLTGKVSGDFEGSPVQLRYSAGLEDDRIVALKIGA